MCLCMEILTKPQKISGKKGEYRFIASGYIMDTQTGVGSFEPILQGLRETPQGRLTVTSVWHPIKYCPNCGEKLQGSAEVDELIA